MTYNMCLNSFSKLFHIQYMSAATEWSSFSVSAEEGVKQWIPATLLYSSGKRWGERNYPSMVECGQRPMWGNREPLNFFSIKY